MAKKRRKKSTQPNIIGGYWLPNLLIWGGTLLMLTGGVIAYPTIQGYLAPLSANSLEFNVTLVPTIDVGMPVSLLEQTLQPELAQPTDECTGDQCTDGADSRVVDQSTPPPPIILPETKLIEEKETPTATPAPTAIQITETPTPEATPEPTSTPSPTPTTDPASLLPSRLVISAINLDTHVIQVGWETQEVNGQLVSSWIVPNEYAAGWHMTSALPGQPGNTVLNGHHNIYGEVFRDLEDLNPGDEIILYSGETPHYYTVTERHILKEKYEAAEIRQQNAQFIMPTDDERLTLVTCWPYTNNTHRLIIVARPVETPMTLTPVAE
jgi:sortase A